jgi:hypothetical protein
MSDHVLYLSSRESVNSLVDGSGWDFDVSHIQPKGGWKNYQVAVEHVSFVNNHYTINSYNNKISWITSSTGATVFTATLTSGVYAMSALITHVDTVMEAAEASHTYGSSLNTSTSIATITISGGATITLQSVNYNCYFELGFENNVGIVSSAGSLVGLNQYDLSGPGALIITTNFAGSNNHTRKASNVLMEIPLSNGVGFKEYYQSNFPDYYPIYNDISILSVRLYDSINFHPFELDKSSDFRMKLVMKPF